MQSLADFGALVSPKVSPTTLSFATWPVFPQRFSPWCGRSNSLCGRCFTEELHPGMNFSLFGWAVLLDSLLEGRGRFGSFALEF